MPETESPTVSFLVSGADPRGTQCVDDIAAASAAEALDKARARGWTDVTIHTDELLTMRQFPGKPALSPRDRVAFLSSGQRPLWQTRLGILWRQNKAVFLWPWLWIAVLCALWMLRPVQPLDLLLVGLIVVQFGFLAWALFKPDAAKPYDRMLQAGVEGRWGDVLDALPRLERLLSRIPGGQDGVEVARLRAGALIKLGRTEEGLSVVRELKGRSEIPRTKILSLQGDCHVAARRYDQAEECYSRLVEEDPQAAPWKVAMAEFQALRRERADLARQALEGIDRASATPPTRAYIRYIEGVIALLERQDRRALELLREAETRFLSVVPDIPTRIPLLAFCGAFRAVAQARLGDTVGAGTTWEQARRMVELHAPTLLKRLCATYIPAARSLAIDDRAAAPATHHG